ncbi:MAG: hypothetical protein GY874_13270 [Desulfobacteraceae bacterium]|nr:hypothetical protein [Desulfobacteraceae bacterium]
MTTTTATTTTRQPCLFRVSPFVDRIGLSRPEDLVLFFFLLAGLIARIRNYLAGISFYVDESALANNLVNLNLSQLFGPLEQNQIAPIGFCVIEKLIILVFGNHEYAFRFLPFIAGSVAVIFAFVAVYRALGTVPAILCAAQLAVIKEPLYYANNLKPYASDLAIALGLVILAWTSELPDISRKRFFSLFIAGIVAVWFSFPSLFVLGAITIVYLTGLLRNRQWRPAVPIIIMGLTWLTSFAIQYYLLKSGGQYDNLTDIWTNRFAVLWPRSLEDIKTNYFLLTYVFRNPLWTSHPIISVPLYLAGCVLLWQKDKRFLLLILLPLVINFIASGLHTYPFRDRLLQYAVIFLFTPIAFCLTWLVTKKFKHGWVKWAGIFMIIANLAEPTVFTIKHIITPRKYEEMKPVVNYLIDHKTHNDRLYIYAHAMKTFTYYQNQLQLEYKSLTISPDWNNCTPESIGKEIRKLSGRVWLIFGHAKQFKGVDYEARFLKAADKHGKRIDQYVDAGASTYLYEFPKSRPRMQNS